MEIEISCLDYLARTYYDLIPDEDSIVPLCGYSDKNFIFTVKNVEKFVLKIVHESESIEGLVEIIDEIIGGAYEYENSRFIIPKPIRTTTANKYSAMATIRSKDLKTGDYKVTLCNLRLFYFYPSITLIELINDCQDFFHKSNLELIYRKSGKFCYELCKFFRKYSYLVDDLDIKRNETKFSWLLLSSFNIDRIKYLTNKFYPINSNNERRDLIFKTLIEFDNIKEKLNNLTKFIIHSDLSGKNILINLENFKKNEKNEKFCLIDFQDIQVGPQIVELSILILYNILEQKNFDFEDALICVGRWTLRGFLDEMLKSNNNNDLIKQDELILIPTLMKLRLCQSLLNGLLANEENPNNDYVMNTNVRGWYLLKLLTPLTDNQDDVNLTIYNKPEKLLNCWLSSTNESDIKRKLHV